MPPPLNPAVSSPSKVLPNQVNPKYDELVAVLQTRDENLSGEAHVRRLAYKTPMPAANLVKMIAHALIGSGGVSQAEIEG